MNDCSNCLLFSFKTSGKKVKMSSKAKSEERRKQEAEADAEFDEVDQFEGDDGDESFGHGHHHGKGHKSKAKGELRFYAVTKDPTHYTPDQMRKRKTRHSVNPPVEHHVGWILGSSLPRKG